MEDASEPGTILAIPAAGTGLGGEVRLPGSKSMTHRGLVLGALAGGTTRLSNASPAEDCRRTAEGLVRLGAGVGVADAGRLLQVRGWGERPESGATHVDAGESGTTARLLLPLLALGAGRCRIDGGPRLRQRPMGPLVDALQGLGVDIRRPNPDATLPLVVEANGVEGGAVELDSRQSSQFASALLLAAPRFRRGLALTLAAGRTVSRPYLEMTCSMMDVFGVTVERQGDTIFRVPAGSRYGPRELEIEGDASAASYFFAAAAVCGGRVRCAPLAGGRSLQGDAQFVPLLERMGCTVDSGPGWVEVRGDGGPLRALDVSMDGMPDLVPTLAVIALFAEGRTTIAGAAHLRWKESDRLGDLVRELRQLGGQVEETEDGLVIEGDAGRRLSGATLDSHRDHRLAMSLSVAGLRLPGTVIRNPGCVAKSHPSFFHHLFSLAGHTG
jgi:3-phosphoshikimate 1-carboxyvinyltransferase